MQRISSNLTIVFKLFIPTFWFTFYGLLTLFIIFLDPETTPLFSSILSKVIFALLFVLFAILIYFTIFKLMRFDVEKDHFYISNYLKTYKYKYEDIEGITSTKFLSINLLKIRMRKKTSLGRTFNILYKKQYWEAFTKQHPQLSALIN